MEADTPRPSEIRAAFRRTHPLTIYPGTVMWLDLLQTLSPLHAVAESGQVLKRRPVVAVKKTIVNIDQDGLCTDDANMLAISATSQEKFVTGRPCVHCKLNPRDPKTAHFWFDTLSTVSLKNETLRVSYAMTADERRLLNEGLNEVLQPEKKFFLKSLFNEKRACMPGSVWAVEIPSTTPGQTTQEVDALVLLRRGGFYLGDGDHGRPHYTPYMIAVLPGRFSPAAIQGLSWNDVKLMPVQERSFRYQVGNLSDETVSIMLNTLRRETGLEPIQYQRPMVRHIFSWLNPLALLPVPGLRGMS